VCPTVRRRLVLGRRHDPTSTVHRCHTVRRRAHRCPLHLQASSCQGPLEPAANTGELGRRRRREEARPATTPTRARTRIVAAATNCRLARLTAADGRRSVWNVRSSIRSFLTKSANSSRHRVVEGGEVTARSPALNLSCDARPDSSEEFSWTRHRDDFKADPYRCSRHDKGLLASLRVPE